MIKFFRASLFIFSCIVGAGAAFGGDLDQARSLFYKGNANYSRGNFDNAVADYEAALEEGFESGPLYYNLGNAYYKKGALGKAILNYTRASRLMPSDADTRANLAYARRAVRDRSSQPVPSVFRRLLTFFSGLFTLDALTVAVVCVYLLLITSLVFFIVSMRPRFYRNAALGLGCIFFIAVFTLFFKLHHSVFEPQGIVVVEDAAVRFEPLETATVFFQAREGEMLTRIREQDTWYKVRREDGKQGWVKKSDMELL